MSDELAGWRQWPGLKTVCIVQRETWNRTPGSHQSETAYWIGSMDCHEHGPEVFLEVIRAHWSIENQVHYVRDVTMGEDACRVRCGSAPQVLAGIRNAAIALFRRQRWTNIAAAIRHYAVKPHEALKLLGINEN